MSVACANAQYDEAHQQFVAFAVAELAVEYHHNRNRVVREKQSVASGDADRVASGTAGSETSGEVGKEVGPSLPFAMGRVFRPL